MRAAILLLSGLLLAIAARGEAPATGPAKVPATDPADAPKVQLPRGAVAKICPSKLVSASDASFIIYTPPDYASSDKRYPVVYFFHGLTDDHLYYFETFSGEREAEGQPSLIGNGKAPPMIFVSVHCGRAKWYRGAEEEFFTKELVPFVDANWRTIASREGRAIEGHSMGGNGALRIGLRHPDLFCSIYAISPGLRGKTIDDIHDLTTDAALKLGTRIRVIDGEFDSNAGEAAKIDDWLTKHQYPHEFETLAGAEHLLINFAPDQLKGLQFHAESFKQASEKK